MTIFLSKIYFPIIVLILVYVLIAIRQIGKFRIQPWQSMMLGAVLVLVTGQIKPANAFKAVNFDVLIFLFGMFVIGEAFAQSGYIYHLSYKAFNKAKTINQLLWLIIISMGLLSPFFINDTMVIVSTPLIIYLAKKQNIPAKPLILAMMFAVTTGSVFSPIGNPQNLLIAMNGNFSNPFIVFFKYLLIPTLINLFIIFFFIKLYYKKNLSNIKELIHSEEKPTDGNLYKISKFSFYLTFALIGLKMLSFLFGLGDSFKLTYISLIASSPILLFSSKRFSVLKKIDWYTLIFFSSMFILMESVWETGIFQKMVNGYNLSSIPVILVLSILTSQLISNVPFVSLYMPLILGLNATAKELTALAAGSTIAGNLLILGAASNIIAMQSAERNGEVLTFSDFAKIGIPLTAINAFVYWFFFNIIP
ncbi:MAG TPA: SLC13 family permease [Petrotogaceae bacterium]|nr:SLC13 family permease [Petrotogaceae bacterium]